MRLLYRRAGSFKGGLFIAAVAITIGVWFYTDNIISDLRQITRRTVQLQVEHFRSLFLQEGTGLELYLREMAKKDFPLVIADSRHEPTSWSGLPQLESLPDSIARPRVKLLQKEWMRHGNMPVPIEIPEYSLTLYFYYGDSALVRRLRYLPIFEIIMVGALILIGYWGFVSIKKNEEGMVWMGLARETAHQMGTPLTSLMGWVELLDECDLGVDLASLKRDMQRDISRLTEVAERFNRLGSRAEVEITRLKPILSDAVAYIHRRLPQLGAGEVNLDVEAPDDLTAAINRDLFAWVIENLVRNGVEALQGMGGFVKVTAQKKGHRVIVDVSDNGVGISRSARRNVFRPGYSTKKRGWGLGLSLARRLIESIHHGKVFVQESKPSTGTTIRIVLPGK